MLAPDDRELGLVGEELAARHLAALGWRVLGRRVRTPAAEVDLCARAESGLVLVEVKTARALALPVPRAHPEATRAAELRRRPGRRLDREQFARLAAAGRFLVRTGLAGSRSGGRVPDEPGCPGRERFDPRAPRGRGSDGGRAPRTPDGGRGFGSAQVDRCAPRRPRVRIDLVEVTLAPRRRGWRIVHHRDLRRPLD